jgi:glycosyltransferase involved in cell wall biosynthesis
MVYALTATVQRIDPDILIGLGYFNADVVTGIKCRAKKIVESHEARIFTMLDKGYAHSYLSSSFMRYYRKLYLRRVERRADVIVTLTKGDAKEWEKARRVEVITNFTLMPVVKHSDCENKRVIAVGRLEWQKGFDRLIEAWAIVNERHSNWYLDIYGSGTMEMELKSRINAFGLSGKVSIHPFTSNINKEYSESSILALSSRYEGFGLVLLEAMKMGLPCVAFDCPFGPSDVVVDNQTGFLVKNGDISVFAEKLCELIEHEGLRKEFSKASVERVKIFDVHAVMAQWRDLFNNLLLQ